MKTDKIINSYLSDVSKLLLCNKKEKKTILYALKEDAEEYSAGKESITRSELEVFLGTPESIAGSTDINTNAVFIKKKLSLKRVLLLAIIAALIIWAVFAIISLIDVHTEAHGYIEEGTLIVQNLIWRFLTL